MPTNTTSVHKKKPRNKVTYISAALPAEGVVRLPSVLAFLGISRTSFHDGIKTGKYPPGKLLSPRCRVWNVVQVRAIIAEPEATDENHPKAKPNYRQ